MSLHPPHAGDGLELSAGFVVSTGIECSAPTIRHGHRQDELVKTGHWERYAEDFALVADFGIRYLRYGVPFHVVARDPARFDWAWTDVALGSLQMAGLEPIADLLHFGVPDGLRGMGDPALPECYAAYVESFVDRFPWIRYYTPVNEPTVAAVMSAAAGAWNERARDDGALVRAFDNLATCMVRGMEIIRARRPDAVFLHSEPCEGYQGVGSEGQVLAGFLNERRFVALDLAFGRRPSEAVVAWLGRHGFGEPRLEWFAQHGSSAGSIVGHDYYRGNEWLIMPDGRTRKAGSQRRGYAALAREYHDHYGLPFMLSETNIAGNFAPGWLAEVWNDALALRAEGLPIRGFCWYGFVDHVDWDSALCRNVGRQNRCGLVDLDRRAYRVGTDYRALARAARAGQLHPIERRARSVRRTAHHSLAGSPVQAGAVSSPTLAEGVIAV
ncbi:family 1 glycosylhydrolase [soil metagenome]